MTFRRVFLHWGLPIAVGATLLVHGLARDVDPEGADPVHLAVLLVTGGAIAALMSAVYVYLTKKG